jgi:hypothetical protein
VTVFSDFAAWMREQGERSEYHLPQEHAKRIRIFLVNRESVDSEIDFLLDQLKDNKSPTVVLLSYIAHHLYDYLQGAKQ